jgi:anti-sigma factor RsiW
MEINRRGTRQGNVMNQHDLHKMMDACRADDGDLELDELQPLAEALERDPELAERFARVRRLDDLLREAVHDVPIPDALEQRLLAAVSGNVTTSDESHLSERLSAPRNFPADPAIPARSVVPFVSRRIVVLAAGTAAAAVLLIAGWWMASGRSSLSEEGLVASVQALTRQIYGEDAVWEHARVSEPPQQHPLAPAVRSATGRWMQLTALDDRQAVAYELAARGDLPAVLLVVRTHKDCGLSPLPYRRLSTAGVSSGWTIAAWQDDDLLYVLVVPGEGRSLDAYIRAAQAA